MLTTEQTLQQWLGANKKFEHQLMLTAPGPSRARYHQGRGEAFTETLEHIHATTPDRQQAIDAIITALNADDPHQGCSVNDDGDVYDTQAEGVIMYAGQLNALVELLIRV